MGGDFLPTLSGSPINSTSTSGVNASGAKWSLGSGDWVVNFDHTTGGTGYGAAQGFPGFDVGTVAPGSGAHAAMAAASLSLSPIMVAVLVGVAWLALRR